MMNTEAYFRTLGDRIRDRRMSIGMNQPGLVNAYNNLDAISGIAGPHFSLRDLMEIEEGEISPHLTIMDVTRIAEVFRCEPSWLLTGLPLESQEADVKEITFEAFHERGLFSEMSKFLKAAGEYAYIEHVYGLADMFVMSLGLAQKSGEEIARNTILEQKSITDEEMEAGL